jgi:lysophospholipase L1-like esterase
MAQAVAGLTARLSSGPMTRIVAFGSSNTERGGHSAGRYNWFDWFDLALRQRYGRVHHVVNAGVSGETTRELLGRFERDVAIYAPHLVFVTIGGNDSNPGRSLDADEFRRNLAAVIARLRALPDCVPALQTYYSCDLERMDAVHAQRFTEYMQIVRAVARDTTVALVDNLARWERLRHADVAAYRELMRDPMHVTPLGNLLWGLDLARAFGAPLTSGAAPGIEGGLRVQARLDALGGVPGL